MVVSRAGLPHQPPLGQHRPRDPHRPAGGRRRQGCAVVSLRAAQRPSGDRRGCRTARLRRPHRLRPVPRPSPRPRDQAGPLLGACRSLQPGEERRGDNRRGGVGRGGLRQLHEPQEGIAAGPRHAPRGHHRGRESARGWQPGSGQRRKVSRSGGQAAHPEVFPARSVCRSGHDWQSAPRQGLRQPAVGYLARARDRGAGRRDDHPQSAEPPGAARLALCRLRRPPPRHPP